MKKICIITLGCKVNQYESDSLTYALKKANFEVLTKLNKADAYIINSCAVTNEAEHKSREQIAKILKLNSDAKIYVAGCSSQLHPNDYLTKPNVKAVVGTENKLALVDAIQKDLSGNLTNQISNTYNDNYTAEPSRSRCYIKIQDGCNNFCSYCIIPYTRGRERSRSVESIKKEVVLQSKKVKEVVLVGINIAGYGKDLKPKKSLTDVAKIFNKHKDLRLRFSSWEMGTISRDLLEELSLLPAFCPFFHISLQNASNEVLGKMNRHYTFSEYKQTIDLIYEYFPNASISTDIIVGFPTETEANFNESLENIKSIRFSNVHVFPYSTREGTVASKLKTINGTIIKERIKKLKEITDKSKEEYLKSNLNKTEEVLIEENKNGFLCGFTKNYIRTYIVPNDNLSCGEVYKVKLIETYKDGCIGEII